jgi:hypothetical protein
MARGFIKRAARLMTPCSLRIIYPTSNRQLLQNTILRYALNKMMTLCQVAQILKMMLLGGKKVLLIAILVITTSSCNAFLREGELLSRQRCHQNARCIESTSRVQSIRAVSHFNSRGEPFVIRDPIDFGVRLRLSSLEWTSCFLHFESRRNALSRTDGYWPYIQKGRRPPQQFTRRV